MATKPSVSTFTCKKLFTTPCKSFIRLFKLKKPVFKRRSTLRSHNIKTKKARLLCGLTSCFRSLRKKKDMDRVMELKSFSDIQKAPCSSPLTPAYIKMARTAMVEEENDGEDGCRRFEKYLVKMVAEEGKMKDLVDVEELLYCWKNLKSPVFMNLVCRFYGELCKDLFPSNAVDNDDNDDDDIRSLM